MMKFEDIINKAFEDEKSSRDGANTDHEKLNEVKATSGMVKLGIKHGYTIKTIDGETIVSFPDGIILKAIFSDRKGISWRLKGLCPNCNKSCWSIEVDTLARMGEMNNRFCPKDSHLRACLRMPGI